MLLDATCALDIDLGHRGWSETPTPMSARGKPPAAAHY
jgi:hypothetical protein